MSVEKLKFMWGFEIGGGSHYYENSRWGIPNHAPTGSDYALYNTQYYEAHQPPTEVGGGERSMQQTSIYQQPVEDVLEDMLAMQGVYSEVTTPVTGAAESESWQNGFVHFSFKHDFDFDFDVAAAGGTNVNGKWIHLCTLCSGSSVGAPRKAFEDGAILDDGEFGSRWMPLPATAPADLDFTEKGYRPEGYISFYLVRQEVEGGTGVEEGGPCSASGDWVVAIVYYEDGSQPPAAVFSSSVAQANIDPDTWSQYAIHYNARSGPTGDVRVWQDGVLILNEEGVKTRDSLAEKHWNSVTFSPHGAYASLAEPIGSAPLFPNNTWPEYSHLVDHLFIWDSTSAVASVEAIATGSLFIQGLAPRTDFSIGNFENSAGNTTNLWEYVDDPGDPTPLEVSYVTSLPNPPTSCSFNNITPVNVQNGAHKWGPFLSGPQSALLQFVGASAIAACSQTGSTNYSGSAFMIDGIDSTELFGNSDLVTEDRLLWVVSGDDIHQPGTEWSLAELTALKMGFKVEPE